MTVLLMARYLGGSRYKLRIGDAFLQGPVRLYYEVMNAMFQVGNVLVGDLQLL